MVTAHPYLYITLPGIALMMAGLIYYRRQKKSRDGEKGNKKDSMNKAISFIKSDTSTETLIQTGKTNFIKVRKSNTLDEDHEFECKLGKSAPINIQGGKSGGINDQSSFLDKEDESYMSSVDLPDSPNKTRCSIVMMDNNNSIEKPVVVKATMNANMSLSNSFVESKYTEEADLSEEIVQRHKDKNVLNNSKPSTADNLSPPSSNFSDHSGDSGKGSSLPQLDVIKITNYDFFLPKSLLGALFGRKRSFLRQLMSDSGAKLTVKNLKYGDNIKICSLKGTEKEIDVALSILRIRFPLKRYPMVTLQKVEYIRPYEIIELPYNFLPSLQLRLIEGINNDVIVTSVISSNHIFIQHPSHPTYPSINTIQYIMHQTYETGEAPSLPELTENAICVVKVQNSWLRVQIVSKNSDDECVVKSLDYGGFILVEKDQLKQIKTDFITIPFQATECLLSDIEPIDKWNQEAVEALYHLTAGLVPQAQIVRYNELLNLPEINLYAPLTKNNIIFINQEMVARGFAKWTSRN